MSIFLSRSASQTERFGRLIAQEILKAKRDIFVISLKGKLGSGKTTFVKGFAKSLNVKEKILSPTFIIMRKFKIKNGHWRNFYHIDCYRIKKQKEILDLGFKEIISTKGNIIAIEWPEKIQKILPNDTLTLKFKIVSQKERKIEIIYP